MHPTIKSVAAAAGVSTATVSYVLSGRIGKDGKRTDSGVAPDTMRRVKEVAQQLGYRPNQSARATRTGRTNLLMLSLTMMSDPWSLDVSKAVGKAASESGFTPMILADSDWRLAMERQNADVLFVDDITDPAGRAELPALAEHKRVVVFDEKLEPGKFDVIRFTPGQACLEAVRFLLNTSDRVALLGASSDAGLTGTRNGAYRQCMEEAGRELEPGLVGLYEADRSSAFDAALKLLSAPNRPTAIFASTDFAAVEAIHAAHRLGLSVPEDLQIIGVGNSTVGEATSPALSTVGPENFFTGLAEFLVHRMGQPEGPGQLLEFQWKLIHRGSTVAP